MIAHLMTYLKDFIKISEVSGREDVCYINSVGVKYGVSQWSNIGLLLFVLYINHLPTHKKSIFTCIPMIHVLVSSSEMAR